jgi:hypothetical protein
MDASLYFETSRRSTCKKKIREHLKSPFLEVSNPARPKKGFFAALKIREHLKNPFFAPPPAGELLKKPFLRACESCKHAEKSFSPPLQMASSEKGLLDDAPSPRARRKPFANALRIPRPHKKVFSTTPESAGAAKKTFLTPRRLQATR